MLTAKAWGIRPEAFNELPRTERLMMIATYQGERYMQNLSRHQSIEEAKKK